MTSRPAPPERVTGGGSGPVVAPLLAARRVLVTGLLGAGIEAVQAACDLAESLGAALDFGVADHDAPAGPTIARVGAVTAAPEELRTRADLVILWACEPGVSDPHVAACLPPEAVTLRLPPDGVSACSAARLIQHLLRGGSPPAGPAWVEACRAARDAIEHARCVAVVSDHAGDRLGLDAWACAQLVREIAHGKPAFEIPLRTGDLAAAAEVCTWRYGAAGAIARADRDGGRFLPGEASARRLVERSEVDCVLVVGRTTADLEAVLARQPQTVTVVRVAAEPAALRELLGPAAGADRGGGP